MLPILVPYHLDVQLPDLDRPIEPELTLSSELPDDDVWARMAALYDEVASTVADTVRNETVPLVMSGDCTTSLATVTGLQRAGLDPSIVWFDAHGDLQTLETTTSGYIGGFPLRMLVGYRPELIGTRLGLSPITEERVVLADARDLDPPEREYLQTAQIRHRTVEELASAELPDGPIYLHIDVDVLDPADLPGLLYPTEGGPSVAAVSAAIAHVIGTGRVAAVGLGCTWYPHRGAAARLGWLVEVLGGLPHTSLGSG